MWYECRPLLSYWVLVYTLSLLTAVCVMPDKWRGWGILWAKDWHYNFWCFEKEIKVCYYSGIRLDVIFSTNCSCIWGKYYLIRDVCYYFVTAWFSASKKIKIILMCRRWSKKGGTYYDTLDNAWFCWAHACHPSWTLCREMTFLA
jgi:hypothetical protein